MASHFDSETRKLVEMADAMGYDAQRTSKGHMRFVHRGTGKVVFTSSRLFPAAMNGAKRDLRRGLATG